LSTIAEFKGHTVSFSVENDGKKENLISIQNSLEPQTKPTPLRSNNKSPNDIIFNRAKGTCLAYYIYPGFDSFNVYYFTANGKIDLKLAFLIDLPTGFKINSETSIGIFDKPFMVLGVYACNDSSTSQIIWFARNDKSQEIS
jgi:hypothetical protein